MSDQPGSTPEDQPTPPPYGEQPAPPPSPSPYGQQPPYGQMPAYGQMPSGGPVAGAPPNYLVWAILTTVFCCLPLGIVSIVYAAQVNNKWALGDLAGARASSRKAKQFVIWSAISSVVIVVLYVVLALVVFSSNN